jgi:hypothetical protein
LISCSCFSMLVLLLTHITSFTSLIVRR